MDKLDAMRAFVRVVERGSFSAVSRELGIGQPAVSKQISALEEELGAELIHRTSRAIALTEPGRDFYESALRILDDFENATSRIGRGQTAPKGLIRVTVPPTFARLHMVSKLPAFFAAYPTSQLMAHREPNNHHRRRLRCDHSGDLPTPPWLRKFAQTIMISSPLILTRHGAPKSPDDLSRFCRRFCRAGLCAAVGFGAERRERVIPTGLFEPAILNRCDGCP